MNIKDRLNKIKQNENINPETENQIDKYTINSQFDNSIVSNIISEQINNFRNIIFITDKSIDNSVVVRYFETYAKNLPKIIFYDKNVDSINIENLRVNIFPEVLGKGLINILEQMLYGVKSFIIGIHLNSYDNILGKLKTIIAINSNLNQESINVLLSALNAVIVNVRTDKNGTLFVKNIDKIQILDSEIYLNSLYAFLDEIKNEFNPDSMTKENDSIHNTEIKVKTSKKTSAVSKTKISKKSKIASVQNAATKLHIPAKEKIRNTAAKKTKSEQQDLNETFPVPSESEELVTPVIDSPAVPAGENQLQITTVPERNLPVSAEEMPLPIREEQPQMAEAPAQAQVNTETAKNSIETVEHIQETQSSSESPQVSETSEPINELSGSAKINKYKLLKEKIKNKKKIISVD